MNRHDIQIDSDGDLLAAWFYPAQSAGQAGEHHDSPSAPCVVMAHGFSMTRADGLEEYAERFAAAGMNVLVFDHRYLGDSGGTPRQRFRIAAQQRDWRAAVAHARSLPGVDPQKVVLWGYSFSGGHVTTLLGSGLDVAAALVLCPFADGLKRVLATPLRLVAWLLPRALLDLVGRHLTIAVTGPPGSHAAMTLPGEAQGFAAAARPGSLWRNEISPAVFLTIGLFRPVAKASKVSVPLWVGRCDDDITVDANAVAALAQRAPRGELHEFPGDHFAPFTGQSTQPIIDEQVRFLQRVLA